jgi:hypothetical protein
VNCGVKIGLPSNHLWMCLQSHGHMKLIVQGHIMKWSQCSLDKNWEEPFLNRRLVTADGHVKGRGSRRKDSDHCEVFSRREKELKG